MNAGVFEPFGDTPLGLLMLALAVLWGFRSLLWKSAAFGMLAVLFAPMGLWLVGGGPRDTRTTPRGCRPVPPGGRVPA